MDIAFHSLLDCQQENNGKVSLAWYNLCPEVHKTLHTHSREKFLHTQALESIINKQISTNLVRYL